MRDAKTVPGSPAASDTVEAAPVLPTATGGPLPANAPPAFEHARYELGEEIARGGMGRVIEATDTMLGRVVALKEVLSLDPDVLRRFARETRITARLEHPSIVPVHDAGELPGGAPFYVMRKISGRPLEQLVAGADTIEKRLVLVPHVVAAAQAVAHAHERGIVHRDIKPSNILVGDLGETIVIDWGLAKVIGEDDSDTPLPPVTAGAPREHLDPIHTRAGIVYGTPGFMAPEQLRGKPVDERCDVYALGATLYHLLSRKPPHHAKTADEMMRLAAREAPPPVGALVAGVPAELSTIIDTALAHEPGDRYRDARALAEDLQRFLSGQLVASHHYSTRERVRRFVRKHRVPVIAVAGAALALVLGGAVAVTRVVGERDRADAAARVAVAEKQVAETERTRAEQRADALTLTQARVEVVRNPTLALAMVRPLATKHWREVRAIAAAARAHGIAWSLPASKRTSTLELSRDGTRALTAGEDGVVRLADLAARTSRELVIRPALPGGPASARFADQERRAVVWHGKQLRVIDLASGTASALTVPTAIVDLEVVGITAYWTDEKRTVWQLDLAGSVPLEVQLDEPILQLSPSPDGRWIALAGSEHLLLHDRTQPATPPTQVVTGTTVDLDWSASGDHLAALVDSNALDLEFGPEPRIVQRQNVGDRRWVAAGGGRVYTIGPTGVAIVSRNDAEGGPRKQLVGEPAGLREGRGGAMIAGTWREIAVLSERGDITLAAPGGALDIVDAHPRSPYVVATSEDRLLVWNLDDVQPRQVLDQPPAVAQLVGSDRAVVGLIDGPARWLDLTAGTSTPLGELALRSVAAAPSGDQAVAIDVGHRGWLVAPGKPPRPLPGAIDVAGFASEHELVVGIADTGAIDVIDTRTATRRALVPAGDAPLADLAWSRSQPPWVAALFVDGSLWRRNLVLGAETRSTAPVAASSFLQVGRDGTVYVAEGRSVRAWRLDNALLAQAELAQPIKRIGRAGDGHLVALLADGSATVIDLAAPNRTRDSEGLEALLSGAPAGELVASMSADSGVIVAPARGGIEVIEPLVDYRWTLTAGPPSATLLDQRTAAYAAPQISTDGRRVIAQLPSGLFAWSIAQPATAAETAAWVESLTNAVIDPRTSRLDWR